VHKPRVFLTGGDRIGWALDEDLRLTKQALQDIVEFTDLEEAEVVHSVWWEGLRLIPADQLSGKRIICHMQNDLFRHEFSDPRFRHVRSMAGLWIARGTQESQNLASVKMNNLIIPYTIDLKTFHPLPNGDNQLEALRRKWDIPSDKYLIGSFQRDTEGRDLVSPKLHKGPDVFLEIVTKIVARGHPIHILLAGSRRFWLRKHLQERQIPYTFIGDVVEADDIAINTLSRPQLNALYNLADLYLVASRYEGGPQAVLEAAASRCKIISPPVGLAKDVLEPDCIFKTPDEAVALAEFDIRQNTLAAAIEPHYQCITTRHTPQAVQAAFQKVYANLDSIPKAQCVPVIVPPHKRWKDNRYSRRLLRSLPIPKLTIGLWHKFFKPPYGGGNQFMLALRKALRQRSVRVRQNLFSSNIKTYLLNSIWFDTEYFFEFSRQHEVRIVHRIDGPIQLYRGKDREKDDLVYEINSRYAFATVLQSKWTYQRAVELGYEPVNPVIIHNAVDPDIFHPHGRIPFNPDRKIRLISTSWSNNPHKGGPIYKWIEDHLDWDRFEYTVVGRASEQFDRIKHLPPVPSQKLSQILRDHDIYITASQNDPCSNALLEALACGLPALYMNSGGHPELVGYGGLPFNDVDEVLPQLDKLAENYTMYQNLIRVPHIDQVADKYLALLQEAANHVQ
jgi:glycosyltransferase involved in cell wall biosynthesis